MLLKQKLKRKEFILTRAEFNNIEISKTTKLLKIKFKEIHQRLRKK